MKRALPLTVAAQALLAAAAPARSGAARQPGSSRSMGAPGLLTQKKWSAGYSGHGTVKGIAGDVRERDRQSRDKAMTLTNSITAALIGLPQQTGKP